MIDYNEYFQTETFDIKAGTGFNGRVVRDYPESFQTALRRQFIQAVERLLQGDYRINQLLQRMRDYRGESRSLILGSHSYAWLVTTKRYSKFLLTLTAYIGEMYRENRHYRGYPSLVGLCRQIETFLKDVSNRLKAVEEWYDKTAI